MLARALPTLALLSLLACGGSGSPLILVSLTGVPPQTAALRATSFLDDVREREPAALQAAATRFAIRLPGGATGRYRLEVEALAEDGCSLAVATGEATLPQPQPVELTLPFSRPLDFRTCLLTVRKSGPGEGYARSEPGDIYCGSVPGALGKCAAQFQQGVTVTLIATPSRTATFDGWSGACSGTAPCHLLMNGPATVTATFGARLP